MSEAMWSNLTTAQPLCRHMLDDSIEAEESGKGVGFVAAWELARAAGITKSAEEFGAVMRKATPYEYISRPVDRASSTTK